MNTDYNYQPTVKVKNLSSTIIPNTQLQSHPNGVSPAMFEKVKKIAKELCPNYPNVRLKLVLVPPGHPTDRLPTNPKKLGFVKPTILKNPPGRKPIYKPGQVITYGMEDLKRDQLLRKKNIKEKQWQHKMFQKLHEKEMKKNVLYKQKVLTRYVLKHQDVLHKHETFLTNARKNLKSPEMVEITIKELETIQNPKIKRNVIKCVKDLVESLDRVPKNKVNSNLNNTLEETVKEKFIIQAKLPRDKQSILKHEATDKTGIPRKIKSPCDQLSLFKQKAKNKSVNRKQNSRGFVIKKIAKKPVEKKRFPCVQSMKNMEENSDDSNSSSIEKFSECENTQVNDDATSEEDSVIEIIRRPCYQLSPFIQKEKITKKPEEKKQSACVQSMQDIEDNSDQSNTPIQKYSECENNQVKENITNEVDSDREVIRAYLNSVMKEMQEETTDEFCDSDFEKLVSKLSDTKNTPPQPDSSTLEYSEYNNQLKENATDTENFDEYLFSFVKDKHEKIINETDTQSSDSESVFRNVSLRWPDSKNTPLKENSIHEDAEIIKQFLAQNSKETEKRTQIAMLQKKTAELQKKIKAKISRRSKLLSNVNLSHCNSTKSEFEKLTTADPLNKRNNKTNSFVGDPFTDFSIISNNKQLQECFCGKPNCMELHPENFYW